jgi:acetylglutamate kinase
MIDLVRAAPHIALHRGKTFVLKLGGEPLAQRVQRRALAAEIACVHALGARLVLVHGGGPQTDAVQRALGEEPRLIGGRRVTSPVALRALCMATAGELHAELLAELSAAGVPATGLAGSSADLCVARRRPPVVCEEGPIDFGAVGDLVSVDATPLEALLAAERVPVVSPPASDGSGGLLNVNADFLAAGIAAALGAAKLVLLTGAPGILTDPARPDSLVSALSLAELDALDHAGSLRGGMKVKSAAIRKALDGGVGRVHVVSGLDPDALLIELYTNHGAGTLVTREKEQAPEPELAGVAL